MQRRQLIAAIAAASVAPGMSFAQGKPIRLVVPFPPGGATDITGRVLADALAPILQQPVVVDNRGGAGGSIGMAEVARAAPDGLTFGVATLSTHGVNPAVFAKLPYDPIKDLQPVTLVARTPFVFVVAQASPIKTWQDFVQQSKTRDMTIGSLSRGTAFHLVWEQTAQRAGITAVYAPSTSSGKTQTDLIGGLLDIVLDAPSSAKGLIDAGKLRAIAITSATRFPGLPQTPTLAESGLPGYAAQPWIALMAPAGTPAEVVTGIQRTVAGILKEPEMVARMESLGMVPVGSSARELADTIAADRKEMEPLIRQLGITLQ